MRVAVTGAAGFVGRAVCDLFTQRGDEVVVLLRRPSAGPWTRAALVGDLATASLDEPLAGVDVVVHLAARVHVMRETESDPDAAFRHANVDATARLLESARRTGARRFVFMSTVKVHGEERDTPYTEADPLLCEDPYGRSKAEAEWLVAGSSRDIETVIIRPPLVYGPGVGGNFARLLKLARMAERVPLPLGAVRNRRSMVALGNLADAVAHAAVHPAAAGEAFLVADAETPSTSDLLRIMAAARGRRARLVPVPMSFLRAAAGLAGRGAEARRMLGSLVVSTERIRSVLGWKPPISLVDGIRATVGQDGAACGGRE